MIFENDAVSGAAVAAMCVTLFVTLILPIILYLVYAIRNKGAGVWGAWAIGALGFVLPQAVIRLPLLSLLSISEAFLAFAQENYLLYLFLLALSAALFETAGRYGAAKLLSRKGLTCKKGIAAGLGHGGIESMLIVGVAYMNNLIYAALINSGAFELLVGQAAASGADTAALLAVRDALTQTAPGIFCLAGYERILTMTVHLALSLLMFYGVWNGTAKRSILLAAALHTALDFFAPLVNGLSAPPLGSVISGRSAYILTYLLLTVIAVAAALMIVRICRRWKAEEQREDAP